MQVIRARKQAPDIEENAPVVLVGIGMVGATLLAHGCSLLLVWFAVLRENPV
jgi:hypothetical protein